MPIAPDFITYTYIENVSETHFASNPIDLILKDYCRLPVLLIKFSFHSGHAKKMINTRLNHDLSLTQGGEENSQPTKKIDLSNVKIDWLNKRALVLISIFAHIANRDENVVIDLRADDVLNQVSLLTKSSDNEELCELYKKIKTQIKLSMVDTRLSDEAAQQVAQASVEQEPTYS